MCMCLHQDELSESERVFSGWVEGCFAGVDTGENVLLMTNDDILKGHLTFGMSINIIQQTMNEAFTLICLAKL